ncbi:Ribulose-phosphate 3-epimerase [Lactobacillus kullabergensis]|uniref:Ribulose-phosphate 3-epimerase n=1 Tax=Lactobacillus kullabergensis TaxID=1218493 RepID=A0A0F4LKB2_9LACO|nr:ribulose-phosphate 3-epimerase [Lactobacillus kullabergensis]KJY59015.1 Ribulose-phosphate 3-epimerase [Lactobacillus kullabergensis]
MVEVAVSLHSGPKINLAKTLTLLKEGGADYFHIDVMDSTFVSEIDFGENLVKEISDYSSIPLDIHMMVNNPEKLINHYCCKTTKVIGIHVESTQHIHRALSLIKHAGKKSEVIINPGTPVNAITPVLDFVDQVMVMSVDPGTSGAKFIPNAVNKVKELDDLRQINHYHYQIEADGSISNQNINELKKAGLDIAVSGSYIFKGNFKKQIQTLKNI